jgi:hypothetical protein
MKKTGFFAPLIFIFLMSCGQKNNDLPASRPHDLKVNYHLDGGMNDYSVNIEVKGDSCHFRKRKDGTITEKRFKLLPSGQDSLYRILTMNKFDKIHYQTEKEIVHDRGGITVTVAWQNESISVSDAQSSFVSDKWYEEWKAVCEGIDAMISKKADQKK